MQYMRKKVKCQHTTIYILLAILVDLPSPMIPAKVQPQGSGLFVCVEVLRPSQPNGVMSSAVSLPNHTFTGQA